MITPFGSYGRCGDRIVGSFVHGADGGCPPMVAVRLVFFSPDSSWIATFLLSFFFGGGEGGELGSLRERPYDEPEHKQIPS